MQNLLKYFKCEDILQNFQLFRSWIFLMVLQTLLLTCAFKHHMKALYMKYIYFNTSILKNSLDHCFTMTGPQGPPCWFLGLHCRGKNWPKRENLGECKLTLLDVYFLGWAGPWLLNNWETLTWMLSKLQIQHNENHAVLFCLFTFQSSTHQWRVSKDLLHYPD